MARNTAPITVRMHVPDGAGGYRLLEELSPEELAAFRHRNAVRMAAEIQRCINQRPELLNALPDLSVAAV